MKTTFAKIAALSFFLALFVGNAYPEEYVPGEVLVKFKPVQEEKDLIHTLRVKIRAVKAKKFKINDVYKVNLVSGTSVESAIAAAYTDPNVEYAEPNYVITLDSTIPNDTSFSSLYGLHNTGQTGGTADADIDAPEAWDIVREVPDNIIIAVIDTGADYNHPDLSENMWVNSDEIQGNNIDDDGNGYIDDYRGWDFVNNDNDPFDGHSHGTHCSGTIAAVGNNSKGVVGVAWRAKIMPLKFLSDSGSGSTSDAIEAVQYATANGAKIMSNSWGGGGFSQALKDAITASHNAGAIFVAAAGNSGGNNDSTPHYPSSYDVDSVIAVAATDNKDALASFSCYGAVSVDIAAPGVSIYSTVPNNSYASYSGTSMATPHISGICALIWAVHPELTNLQVKARLLSTVDKKSALTGKMVSEGRANAYRAVTSEQETIPPSAVTDLSVTSTTYKSAVLSWTATGDDDLTGTASVYDIRYSTSPIDENNFGSATAAQNIPVPKTSGSSEIMTVQPLGPNTTYYFAMKVLDEWGNTSGLSNIVSIKTGAASTIYKDAFENGTNGWTISGTDGIGGASLWHQSTHKFKSTTTSWYYGKEATYTYDTGARNYGSIMSPAINLSQTSSAELIFNYWRSVESYSSAFDVLKAEVSYNNGSTWQTLWSVSSTTASEKAWMGTEYISLQAGSSNVRIRFSFDTIDSYANSFEGVYIDDVEVVGVGSSDTTPPADISNLSAKETGAVFVKLQWTAPGNDGNSGTAATYDIRYNTEDITNNTWDSSVAITGEPTPSVAGNAETMTVTGLTPNIKYYFAIKSKDDSNNESGLSNILCATTIAPAKISVEPAELPLVSLNPDDTSTKTLVITNTGSSPLEFSLTDTKVNGLNSTIVQAIIETENTPSDEIDTSAEYVPDEILVKPNNSDEGLAALEQINVLTGAEIIKEYKDIGVYLLRVGADTSIFDAINEYENNPRIEYAEPNYIAEICKTPNDPKFGELYGLHNIGQSGGTADCDIDAPEAWDYWTGSDDVVVAVIDTGVDYNHQDLSANMWHNPGETPGNGIDDDGNGYIDDYYGYDFCNNDGDPFDDNSHGTHCSGTIGGVGNNTTGVAGVCWTTKIMALKFLSSGGSGSYADAVEATIYAANMGVEIASNSWGGGSSSQTLKNAIEYAKTKGMLFVAAAGNSAVNADTTPMYPAAFDCANIISVAATSNTDALASFSNYGAISVDLGAPGVSILSTIPNNSYAKYSGTSMATPHVSGAAALVWSQRPNLTYNQVRETLLSTVNPTSSLSGKTVTGGRLNVFNAIQKENDTVPPNAIADLAESNKTCQSITLTWTATGDDGDTGTATQYDLRYSTSEITSGNFANATQVSGEPNPSSAGTKESVTVTGLEKNTVYYFALKVADNAGNSSGLSNVTSSTTKMPTTVFTDDMEQGTTQWTAQSPWEQTVESAHSGTICWTDSPYGNYSNNSTINLTTRSIDLTNLSSASLEFWQKYDLESGYDYGYVEITSDGGTTWTQLKSNTGTLSTWTKVKLDLSACAGKTVKLRFKLTADNDTTSDGWYIDDVSVYGSSAESGWLKPDITSGTIQPNQSKTITLTYDACGLDLGNYSTELNVSSNDPDNGVIVVPASLIVEATPPTGPPNISITSPLNGLITKQAMVTVSGTIDYKYSVVKVNGVGAVVSNNTFGATIQLSEGQNTISVIATNSAGSTAKTLQVILDTVPPLVAITQPADATKTKQTTVTVTGTVSDNRGISSIVVNSHASTANEDSTFTHNVTLDEGNNTITAQATDVAGNITAASVIVVRDTTAPTITVTSPSSGSITTLPTSTITGSVNDLEAVVTVNGEAVNYKDGTFNKTVNLSVGANTFTISASDTLGNTSTRSLTITYVLGAHINISPSTLPAVTLQSGQTTTQSLTISNTGDADLVFSISMADTNNDSLEMPMAYEDNEDKTTYLEGERIPTPEIPEYYPNRVLVKFKDGIASDEVENVNALLGAETIKTYERIGVEKIEYTANVDIKEAIAAYVESGTVEFAEPDFIVSALVTPNDPQFTSLWGLHNTGQNGGTNDADIDAPEAWNITQGSDSVIIAVIDTGVDYTHPDLAANIWTNSSGKHGYDYYNNDDDPMDDNNHGTHCSGTIAGVGNNGTGVAGVSWRAKIMALKFLSSAGSGSTSDAVDCILYAVDNGARVLSNSWGGGGYSQTLYNAIEYANSHNVLFVAAAGNSASNNDATPTYPASYTCSNIISVAALDKTDKLASFSCYGATTVDIGAPGVSITSTIPNNSYATYSGTSMATPHVAGVAGLVLAQNINATAAQVKQKIMNGTVPISALTGKCLSGGRLNAYNALDKNNDTTPPSAITDLAATSATFQSAVITWTAPGDDGNTGTASYYDVRYSTSVITSENFSNASQVSNAPTPLPSGNQQTCVVTGLSESTKYYFAIKSTDDAANTSAISNNAQTMTSLASIIFTDTMENGTGNWATTSPWGLITSSYHSSSHCLTDSPSGNYGNNVSTSITSVQVDLSKQSSAKLTFWHKYKLETYYDYAYVLVSDDNGSTWDLLKTFNGSRTAWGEEVVDLTAYCGIGKTNVKLRFLLQTDYSVTYDGWYIDDVTVYGSKSSSSWLTVSSLTDTLSPGQSTVVTLYYNSQVAAGNYTEYLFVSSNDAANPIITVEANLTVESVSTTTWYLPEGCTINPFKEYILVMNPNNEPVTVHMTFMKPDGTTVVHDKTIGARSRGTTFVNSIVPNASVSTMIEAPANKPIVCERSSYWDSGNIKNSGATNSMGIAALNKEWYLAEGCTLPGFSTWVLIMNPSSQSANITATFMKPDGKTIERIIQIGPTTRYTINVNNIIPSSSVSVKIVSDIPVAVERAMYFDNGQYKWIEGHTAIAVPTPYNEWYFAEGCAGKNEGGFDEWILLMNPNSQPTSAVLTFMKENGSTIVKTITIAETSRFTVRVRDIVTGSVSTHVHAELPIVAERSMYWGASAAYGLESQKWFGGHASQGAPSSGTRWYLAEGYTANGFDTWLLLMNPNGIPAQVKVTFMKPNGENIERTVTVPATGRYTINVNQIVPNSEVSMKAESQNGTSIIAERSVYISTGEHHWKCGHNSVGAQI